MPGIFLSYNREDADIARSYADAFAREGLEVWWDATLRSGEAYDEVTEAALRDAKAVVVLWSPRSVVSRWVRAEATIAERNKTLMPVTIEPCERPVMFELTQTADLSHWRGEADDKGWLAFLDDVRRMIGRGAAGPAKVAFTPAPLPAAAAGSGIPNVAVLPIAHRGGGEDMEFLSEDLTEDITRELTQNPFFKVIAASTMATWRGKAIDHRALGREVEARYLIEGKLQRTGENIRLTVQLIEAVTGGVLWSERMARKLADLEEAPDEFAAAVATELGNRLIENQTSQAVTQPGPFSAWQHLLRSMAFQKHIGSDSSIRGIAEGRLAVEAAPDLGIAHAMLAIYIAGRVASEGIALNDSLRLEIQTHARRALQLDGDNPMVIARLAGAYSVIGDGETCLRLARRAVEINPDLADARHMLAMAYLALGRTADAIPAFMELERCKGSDLNPIVSLTYLGMSHLLEGQPAEAEAAIDRALAIHPDSFLTLKWKAIVAARRGQDEVALAAISRLRAIEPTITIDQHVRQINFNPYLAKRSVEEVAILRRLWDATEVDA